MSRRCPLESDNPLDGGDVVESPAAKVILEIHQLFGKFIQFPEARRFSID